ncbi:MAG: hypothetical protein AB7O21_19810 [Gammaproteobacteria bacterium]
MLSLEFMFEHRCYLPSVGIFITVVDVVARVGPRRWAIAAASFAIPLVLCALLVQRVEAWRTKDSLLADMLEIHPRSPRALALRATELMNEGQYSDALATLAGLRGIGPTIQRERIRCRSGQADFSEVEKWLNDPNATFDQYAIAQVAVLAHREPHCLADPRRFLRQWRARFGPLRIGAP